MIQVCLFLLFANSHPDSAETDPSVGWIKMPWLSTAQRSAGLAPGGEGCQWPRGPVAVSPANPDFLLLGTDVGGLYRSFDGGKHWGVAMVGWNARGANGFAIDPRTSKRILGLAGNSSNWVRKWGSCPNGIYLSTDQAGSWKQVLADEGGFNGVICTDPSSYDSGRGFCLRSFYISAAHGLQGSEDGGLTWSRFLSAPDPGTRSADWSSGGSIDPKLAIDPRNGWLYLSGVHGLYVSTSHGKSWSHPYQLPVSSLCVEPNGTVVIGGDGTASLSDDGGVTWKALALRGLDTLSNAPIKNLVVSPVDSGRMLCWVGGGNFQWIRYSSQNGGGDWQRIEIVRDGDTMPMNNRQSYATWSPKDPNVAWSLGGDWVTRSADGGHTLRWSNNGYNGVMTGGFFGFSPSDPDCVFIGAQDYNGAFTSDGGQTWNYRDVSGKGWGGFEYGALALSREVMWCGDAEGWGSPRRLRLTLDGGSTWSFVKGANGSPLEYGGPDVSFADPGKPGVGFAGSLRTADRGQTWKSMKGCQGVFAAGTNGAALYGAQGDTIVQSSNHGLSWDVVAQVHGGLSDLAVDESRHLIYVASEDVLKVWNGTRLQTIETPKDQYGGSRVTTVAVDPVDPRVVYVGGAKNVYASMATICRSTDGGRTWRNLTVTSPLGSLGEGGPHEVSAIRVDPVTREAWVAGQCYGLWRLAPPAPAEVGRSASGASAPLAPAVPYAQ